MKALFFTEKMPAGAVFPCAAPGTQFKVQLGNAKVKYGRTVPVRDKCGGIVSVPDKQHRLFVKCRGRLFGGVNSRHEP